MPEREKIGKDDVLEAFRKATWDLYVTVLRDPKIVDASKEKEADAPRGFCIDPKTWTVHFNTADLPQHIHDPNELGEFSRGEFHHEILHWEQVPHDAVTEAVLIDAAVKGFSPSVRDNKEYAATLSRTVLNIFGDIVGNTFLAEGYGRENFRQLTVDRYKNWVHAAKDRLGGQQPSLLWQTLVATYEGLWGEDIGLRNYIGKLNPKVQEATQKLIQTLDGDWRDRTTWEAKATQFAKTLEPIIREDINREMQKQQYRQSQQGYSQGRGQGTGTSQGSQQSGIPLPDDLKTIMCDPKRSHFRGSLEEDKQKRAQKGDELDVDPTIAAEIYKRNQNPRGFAGTMGALEYLDPDDALRLLYRERARELLMKIKEQEKKQGEVNPSYTTPWNIGDKLVGRGGLELVPSMLASGKPIPGITTVKRRLDYQEGYKKIKMIPDLFLVIDSSGSMSWNPWQTEPDGRGEFDKAILAAEGAALYALNNRGYVAVLNFSGEGAFVLQPYTRDLNRIELALMRHYNSGTVLPSDALIKTIRATRNPLITSLMSDCNISNGGESLEALSTGITQRDKVTVFHIAPYENQLTAALQQRGAIIYPVRNIDNLVGLVIGAVKSEYDARKPVTEVYSMPRMQ